MNMKIVIFFVFMIFGVIMADDDKKNDNCDACGPECKPACGTKWFKTCCNNYLRRNARSIELYGEEQE